MTRRIRPGAQPARRRPFSARPGGDNLSEVGGPGSTALAEEATQLRDLEVESPPRVGIVVEQKRDTTRLEPAEKELRRRKIRYELRVMSAYTESEHVADYARNAKLRGLRVIIAAGQRAPALPALVAAHTDLPVIGVPLSDKRSIGGGLDALVAIVQAPASAPVAVVALDSPENAAALAVRILSM